MWSDEVPAKTGATAWSAFPEDTPYFGTGPQTAMVNYRVDDLDALALRLTGAGIPMERSEDASFGRFAWITDPEGNRLELWEPLVSNS